MSTATEAIRWHRTLEEAQADARAHGRPVFLDFFSPT